MNEYAAWRQSDSSFSYHVTDILLKIYIHNMNLSQETNIKVGIKTETIFNLQYRVLFQHLTHAHLGLLGDNLNKWVLWILKKN